MNDHFDDKSPDQTTSRLGIKSRSKLKLTRERMRTLSNETLAHVHGGLRDDGGSGVSRNNAEC
jgi:hypothetical protein